MESGTTFLTSGTDIPNRNQFVEPVLRRLWQQQQPQQPQQPLQK